MVRMPTDFTTTPQKGDIRESISGSSSVTSNQYYSMYSAWNSRLQPDGHRVPPLCFSFLLFHLAPSHTNFLEQPSFHCSASDQPDSLNSTLSSLSPPTRLSNPTLQPDSPTRLSNSTLPPHNTPLPQRTYPTSSSVNHHSPPSTCSPSHPPNFHPPYQLTCHHVLKSPSPPPHSQPLLPALSTPKSLKTNPLSLLSLIHI